MRVRCSKLLWRVTLTKMTLVCEVEEARLHIDVDTGAF